ncbi:MAG: response regulator, partial [Deltaproteobacteria bacterium]|nr:response regulator [Deltaproteobacteria bacterium]
MPQRPKILIVDDETTILDMLSQILTPRNYAVQLTTSGTEALCLLAQDDYQLMIADINMPRMDGLELTRR